jgi:uncharacterized protein (TIGR00369 family)
MDEQQLVEQLNAHRPNSMRVLNGSVLAYDPAHSVCRLGFEITTDFCHSVDVVQGGFVTSMLDAAMSHAAFGIDRGIANVATLEVKVNFLEASRAGRFTAEGRVVKASHRTAFLCGELFDEAGLLTATASATAKLVRAG